jgi:hypothetical protein
MMKRKGWLPFPKLAFPVFARLASMTNIYDRQKGVVLYVSRKMVVFD